MNEPRRLRHGGGPSQRLLDSASLDVPGPAARQRAALLASTAGAFSTTAAPASAAPAGAPVRSRGVRTLLTWASIAAAASIALAFAGSRLFDAHDERQPHRSAAPGQELPSARSAAHPADIAPEVLSPRVEPWVQRSALAAAPAEEALAIELARGSLSRNDHATALRVLDDFDQKHPQAQLRPEAAALRVQALLAAGQLTEARAHAQQFAKDYPQHPLAGRVQQASQ